MSAWAAEVICKRPNPEHFAAKQVVWKQQCEAETQNLIKQVELRKAAAAAKAANNEKLAVQHDVKQCKPEQPVEKLALKQTSKHRRSQGDFVRLGGVRSKPELNGYWASVAKHKGDDQGRVLVRLRRKDGDDSLAGRMFLIEPKKLFFASAHETNPAATSSSTGFGRLTRSSRGFSTEGLSSKGFRSKELERQAKAMSAYNLLESIGPKASPYRCPMMIGVAQNDPVERQMLGLPARPAFERRVP
eukprot:TRINITY_DN61500_c0_g1_i1.p1 TRINITY_DN61500_c0_g1~~TRINITY_DN61500_c0_g1_i1.p1  ORF type:complete len:245 (+),score=48.34 TRINITY_DN61500_c0_g1_i1:30-764(+)